MPRLPPIEAISPAEAETVDYVVCAPADFPTPFTGNVKTVCAACGAAIMHRPYAPKRPPKVCVACAYGLVRPN